MRIFVLTLLSIFTLGVYGQGMILSGVVKDTKGEPLVGTSIYIVGQTSKGVTSGADGTFSLSGVKEADVVRFTFIGYLTQDVTYRGQAFLNIVMEEDATTLDDVVIVGYGTQEKKDLTGSLSTVSNDVLASQPSMIATQAIQGKVAGLQIVNTGAPGSSPQVRIRGTGTLLGGADPLYVVDGVLTTDIRNINNSDIKSVEVLKDASSAAIYGVRGANGVIIITTYQGEEGKPKVSYNMYMGFNAVQNKVKMADSYLFGQYTNEALEYEGQDPLFDLSQPIQYNTEWLDVITRKGQLQEQNISLSGGTSTAKYYGSASFYKNNGILSTNAYERLTVRLSNDITISKHFEFGMNIGLSTFRSANAPYSAFTAAYRAAPNLPAQYSDGSYSYFQKGNVGNPLAIINYTNDTGRGTRIQGNAYLVVKPWIKGLSFRSQISVDWSANNGVNYTPAYTVSSAQRNDISILSLSKDKYTTWIWDNIFTYERSWGKNRMTVTLGMTAEEQSSTSLSGSRKNVPPQENYWTLSLGDISTVTNGSSKTLMKRASYLARVFYSWDDKYLVTATARVDGSSRFPSSNRWAFFPSFGVAWRMTQEPFLKDNRTISNMKIRASWGVLGNDAISSDAFMYTINSALPYVQGKDQYVIPGGTVTDIKDPDLKWEKTSEFDVGVDFGFFSDRLWGSFDVYMKKTQDALIYAPIDAVFGDPDGAYLTNKADITNSGYEFTIGWNDQTGKNWKYNISYNFTYNRNKITAISDGLPIVSGVLGNGQQVTRTQIDQPVGAFWVYQTDGIFHTQAELDQWIADGNPVVSGTKVGDLKYIDRSGNGTLGDEDRYCPGAYSAPWVMGLNVAVNYRQWDFALELYSVMGNKIYNGNMALRFGNENIQQSLKDRWTADNTQTNTPRASNTVPLASDYYVHSGSFLKLNTITAGYTLPKKITEKMKMSRWRFYVSALNPLVLKKYNGYSAELPSGTLNSGLDLDAYPQMASYLFGMNINF